MITPGYNSGVLRHALLPLAAAILLAGCNRAPESKEAIKAGVVEHLSKNSGLDLKSMDVDVTSVKFEGNQAVAMVAFKPKQSPDAGMSMSYKLEKQGSKWNVTGKAGSSGHAGAGGAPSAAPEAPMPPGHPPVDGNTKPSDLPKGHPPISQPSAPSR